MRSAPPWSMPTAMASNPFVCAIASRAVSAPQVGEIAAAASKTFWPSWK
jgi:hypothetical protein